MSSSCTLPSATALIEAFQEGQRHFRGIHLHRSDLSHVNLPGIDLTGSWLIAADLTGASLSRSI